MSQHWFIRRGHHEKGPYSLHDLIRMARKEKLLPTDLVRTPRSHGRNNWRPAVEIKTLFGDPELLAEARRMAGDEPSHPDNRADWIVSVQENYEELLAETLEAVIESDSYEDSFADSNENDALVGRRHFSAAAGKPTGPNVRNDKDSSQKSAQPISTSLVKGETAQVIDDFDDLLPPTQNTAEVISTGPSTGDAAWVPDDLDLAAEAAINARRDDADPVLRVDDSAKLLPAHQSLKAQTEYGIARRLITSSVVEDQAKGMHLLLALAEEGHTDSQGLLGWVYWVGTIVPKDCETASKWFRKAAEADDGWSMQRLGIMLFNGDGIETNETEAFGWFQRAANLGIDEAMNSLAICYLRGRGTAEDGEKAIHWLQRASELGCEVAQYNLGRRYFHGEFVERDYETAFSLFKLASRWNEKDASPSEWYIYWCYKEGLGTEPDLKTAVEWVQKGANRECPMSMAELGRMHMYGEFVDRDFQKGTQLLQKAAIAGEAHAQFFLGIAFQNGNGVPHDEGEAIRWFYLASKNRSKDTDGFVLGNELAVSHLWDMIAPLISDRLRFSLG